MAYLLIRFCDLNVWGLMISTIAFAFVLCILNWFALRRKVHFHMELKTSILVPLCASIGMGVFCWGAYYVVYRFTQSNFMSFLLAFVVAVIAYFVFVFLLHGISEEELRSLPKGHILVRIAKKLHLLPS
jgi:stage V sporulation protein B